jgi:hypothetical protein
MDHAAATARLRAQVDQRLRTLALKETDAAATAMLGDLRSQMGAAGLGNLGQGIGAGSDKKKNGEVHMQGSGGWSASGWVFIRSLSNRSQGAIEAYTEGATIAPRRGRWLWIATDDVKRLVGAPFKVRSQDGKDNTARIRLQPRYWDSTYGAKFGPLQVIRGARGPLLIVKNASLSLSGKPGSLKTLTKAGNARKGQVAQDSIVAFYAIPNTSRAARVNPRALASQQAQAMLARLGSGFTGGLD